MPPVVRATSTSVICEDGTEILADALIICTGYKYNYPFLLTTSEPEQKVDQIEKMMAENLEELAKLKTMTNNGEGLAKLKFEEGFNKNGENKPRNVKATRPGVDLLEDEEIVGTNKDLGHLLPLYKHLFHARYPTLGFIGVCKIVIPFPLFHCQAQFFLSVLEGKCQLPPPQTMLEESRQEVVKAKNVGIPLKYLHRLEMTQWEYNQWLADTAGFEPLAPVLSKMYEATRHFRKLDPDLYRTLDFHVLNREEFEMRGGELIEDRAL